LNGQVQTEVEELPENRVRLTVQVPSHDVHHAIEHAATDLAASVKIPGFRKGKVPRQVLLQRVGKDRLMAEAIDSHITGWFWNAAARSRLRPVAQPEYDFELDSDAAERLALNAAEDAVVFAVVTLRERLEDSTVNLLGPIVVNRFTHEAAQVVLPSAGYSVRAPLAIAT